MISLKRVLTCGCTALLLLSTSACKHKSQPAVETSESAPQVNNVVAMNDPKAQPQLVTGFYAVEAGTWRWTAGKFAVVLRTPTGSETRGATLNFSLSIPETVIHATNGFTLSCKVGDTALPPQSFNHSGNYVYSQDVPASALRGDSVRVDFALNKTIPAGQADHRELGLVAKQISLVAK